MPAWIRRFPVTALLIAANVAVFLLQLASGVPIDGAHGAQLVNWGANLSVLTLGDEPGRLFSSMFLHIGVLHLVVNMYSLLVLGPMVERFVGSARYSAIYLGAGLAGGLTSALWNPVVISAGASGAIMGLAGAYLALLLLFRDHLPHATAAIRQLAVVIVLNIGMGFAIPGIDNACHLGGLVGGALLAAAYVGAAKRWRPWVGYIAVTVVATLACWGTVQLGRTDALHFDRAIEHLIVADGRYGDFRGFWLAGQDGQRAEQFDAAQQSWQQCVTGMDQPWQLDTGDARLATGMAEYCNLRLAQYRVNRAGWDQHGTDALLDTRYAREADAVRARIWRQFEPRAALALQRLQLVGRRN
ncbi:rhomboid family intramembrane serine protease [Chitinolyticbacter meiyuanensis]|uniref:rhomboid family intramembrane serine protease n=1 Tax=Chitinolyticbacter meiyuanensis TaxID=682798 RepID=UPI0011E5B551|nr:rhomboid family intramembrane serine protease [Chitinolyticbacter meiyuanensis]